MIRFAPTCLALAGAAILASASLLGATPVQASDLVVHEVLSEQPLSDAAEMKVVISRVTIKPDGMIKRHAHPGDMHAVVLRGGRIEGPDGTEQVLDAGRVIFVSAGDAHGPLRNLGDSDIELMVTYVVNILEPFSWPVE
ncbi:cupin domain-containing protein [Mameliella sp.]|uniref:cupin domain-containing protein n=1 Tax=Mameliella sp. TaxID=1924940 RepID=UPI003B513099